MRKYLICLLIIFILGFLVAMIYLPMSLSSQKDVIFKVEKGEGSRDIAFNLQKQGLIRWAPIFRLYVVTIGISGKLQAGAYLLSPQMNISQIAEKMAGGDIIKIKITIPEGFNLTQIEKELNSSFENKNIDFQFKNRTLDLYKKDYDFLEDAPDKAGLEGYLFPDTYWFSYGVSNEDVLKAMFDNFSQKLTPTLRKDIKNQNKRIFEIINMASLLEKEVKTTQDKKIVSGILWKRIKKGIPLQVDATIIFITGKENGRVLTGETKIDSPYNTYKYKGLPIGPIDNPGIESIIAAVYPEESPYFYYLSDSEGETIFSKTLEEHNLAKSKYLPLR